MNTQEQINQIKQTLIEAETRGHLSIEMFTFIEQQINTLDVTIKSELIAAESKGMTEAYGAMSATVDAKGEYYVEDAKEISDSDKQAYYHEEHNKRLSNQLNQE